MKVEVNVIPPVPVEPEKEIVLRMTAKEAQQIRRVGNYALQVATHVNKNEGPTYLDEQILSQFWRALKDVTQV